MTASLTGRLHTRLLLATAIGIPITLLLALLTPLGVGQGLATLAIFTALGLLWDIAYNRLQRLRWDHDWPTLFQLTSLIPEALLALPVLHLLGVSPSLGTYALQIATIGLTSTALQHGPLSVLLPHWRHDSGRITSHRPAAERRPKNTYAPEPRKAARAPHFAGLAAAFSGPRLVGAGILAVAVVGALSIARLAETPQPTAAPQSATDQTVATGKANTPMNMPHQNVTDHWDTSSKVTPIALTGDMIKGSVQPVGLDANGSLSAPSSAGAVAWYSPGPAPGQSGASVLTGATSGPGAALAGLQSLTTGSTLNVRRSDGSQVEFKVTKVIQAGPTNFPTREVYGPTKTPSLRLIGATGSGTTVHDTIVFATASGLVQTHA